MASKIHQSSSKSSLRSSDVTKADCSRRHLIRLWLRDPENAWETPKPLQSRWDGVYAGVTPEKQAFPLEPEIRGPSRGATQVTNGHHSK